MGPEEGEGQRRPEDEPELGVPQKVIRLHEALKRNEIPHAFGGAIAVDYYRVPRGTIDIDLALFVRPGQHDRVIRALEEEFSVPEKEELVEEIEDRDQGVTHWGPTRIDLFFSIHDFHEQVEGRVRTVEHQDTTIPILSAEDIVVFKAMFDRPQDWADIDAVCKLRGDKLDLAYMRRWLGEIVGVDDPRVTRLVEMVEGASDGTK